MRTQRETDLEDLIERLRYYKKQAPWSPCGKAAKEIDRLATELECETKRADGNLDALKAAIIEEKRLNTEVEQHKREYRAVQARVDHLENGLNQVADTLEGESDVFASTVKEIRLHIAEGRGV